MCVREDRPADRLARFTHSPHIQAIYISSELRNPSKQLPLTINTALPTIFLCFLVANAAYYILLPWDLVSTSDSVAVVSRPPNHPPPTDKPGRCSPANPTPLA